MGWWARLWRLEHEDYPPINLLPMFTSRSCVYRKTSTTGSTSRSGWVEENGHRRPMTEAELATAATEMDAAERRLDKSMEHLDRSMDHLDQAMQDLDKAVSHLPGNAED